MKIVLKPGETLEVVGAPAGRMFAHVRMGIRVSASMANGDKAELSGVATSVVVSCPGDESVGGDQPQQPKPPVQPAEAPDRFSDVLYDDNGEPVTPMSERRVPRYEDQPGGHYNVAAH